MFYHSLCSLIILKFLFCDVQTNDTSWHLGRAIWQRHIDWVRENEKILQNFILNDENFKTEYQKLESSSNGRAKSGDYLTMADDLLRRFKNLIQPRSGLGNKIKAGAGGKTKSYLEEADEILRTLKSKGKLSPTWRRLMKF